MHCIDVIQSKKMQIKLKCTQPAAAVAADSMGLSGLLIATFLARTKLMIDSFAHSLTQQQQQQ